MSGKTPLNRERPIFVGASGRRLRTLRVAGAMVVLPAVGYVGVLLIALIGGFLLHSPLLPFAAPPKATAAPRPLEPRPASPTTNDLSTSVFVVVSARQRRSPAPPVATPATMSTSKGSLVLGVVRSAERARPAPVAAKAVVTPNGRPVLVPAKSRVTATAQGRPAVVAAKAGARVTSTRVPVANEKPAVVAARATVAPKGGRTALPTPPRLPIRAGR